jgi:hypothetical protein
MKSYCWEKPRLYQSCSAEEKEDEEDEEEEDKEEEDEEEVLNTRALPKFTKQSFAVPELLSFILQEHFIMNISFRTSSLLLQHS